MIKISSHLIPVLCLFCLDVLAVHTVNTIIRSFSGRGLFSCRQFIEDMLSLLMCILTSAPIKPISKNNFHKPVKGRQSAIIVECDAHYIVCSSLQSKQLPGTG